MVADEAIDEESRSFYVLYGQEHICCDIRRPEKSFHEKAL